MATLKYKDSAGNWKEIPAIPGVTPNLTVKVTTLAEGASATVTQSGTPEFPIITLGIPRGNTGAAGADGKTYTLPSATSSVLGGVKTGSNITNSSGTISISKSNVTNALGYTPVSPSGGTISGNLTVTGTLKGGTVQSTSDSRLKSNIVPIDYSISSLKAYKYILNEDKKEHIGLIAQEVLKEIPEAVFMNEEGYYSLDYNAILAILVNKVNQLDVKLTKLEG